MQLSKKQNFSKIFAVFLEFKLNFENLEEKDDP